MKNLLTSTAIVRVMNAVAAGTSDQTSGAVDTADCEGVMFIASLGTLTASQVTQMKVQQSDDDGVADDYSDLAGSKTIAMADGDSNKLIVIDVYRPRKRWLKVVLKRGTANAVIDGVVGIKYGRRVLPTTQPGSVQASLQLASPAEGTA